MTISQQTSAPLEPVSALPSSNARRTTLGGSSRSVLRTLMYHRIGTVEETPDLNPVTLSATPDGFREQMELLARRFRVVSWSEVVECLEGRRELPPRAVLITFDDGYDCFSRYAWPVLRQFNLPATMFVPTAFPEGELEFWWDRLHRIVAASASVGRLESPLGECDTSTGDERRRAARRIADWVGQTDFDQVTQWLDEQRDRWNLPARPAPVMNWDELKLMASQGLSLAPHSRTHPPLTCVSRSRLVSEVNGSLDDLRREIGLSELGFAYPGGFENEQVREVVRDAGYLVAFSTRRGAERVASCDVLSMRRINVGRRATTWKLWCQLAAPVRLLNLACDLL